MWRFVETFTKWFTILGPVLTCDASSAVNNIARAEFTNSFCWSSSSSANEACKDRFSIDNSTALLPEHETAKYFYRVFPYLLIAQVGELHELQMPRIFEKKQIILNVKEKT